MPSEMIVIGALGVIASGAFGWFFAWFSLVGGYSSLILAIIFALIYLALFTVRMLITKRKEHAGAFIACDILVFLLSFAGHFSLWLAIAGIVTAIWLYTAWHEGRRSTDNMLRIRLKGLAHGFVKSSFRAVLFLGIASYLSLVNPDRIAVSRTFIANSIASTIDTTNQSIIEQVVGRPITAEESSNAIKRVSTGLHAGINALIATVPPQAKTALLVGIGIIVFLLASSLTSVLMPLVMLSVWGVMQLLLRFKIITIKTEKADREVIVL